MEVIVLVGLPGAGKSSFSRERLSVTHLLISKDQMRSRKNREARQQRWLRTSLAEGRSVAIDNTNPSRASRRGILELAHAFSARTIAYYFPLTIEQSLERNQGPGRRVVPPVAIYSAARLLEPPSLEEGFHEVREIAFDPSTHTFRNLHGEIIGRPRQADLTLGE